MQGDALVGAIFGTVEGSQTPGRVEMLAVVQIAAWVGRRQWPSLAIATTYQTLVDGVSRARGLRRSA
eukprot:1899689-Lingulodinium_polyedra.AAC.1